MNKVNRAISATDFMKKTYATFPNLPTALRAALGDVEKNFRMLITGPSGHGKTTFAVTLARELSILGRVLYNSIEQGEGKALQETFRAVGMDGIKPGSLMLASKETFEQTCRRLGKKRSAQFVILDSAQYMGLTVQQYQKLIEDFPRKSFIIISWEKGGRPKGEHAKAIEYMVDIKCYVHQGRAVCRSRFGATEPRQLFEWKPSKPAPVTNLFNLQDS